MVTSSFWLWAAQRSFYLKHVRVSTVRRATVYKSHVWTRAKLYLPALVAGAHSTRGFARPHTGRLAGVVSPG